MKLYYRLYLPGPQHFFRNSNRAMATGWSFTRTLFPPLTRHPVYSATICCAVFSPPSSHLILVQSSSAHPARTPLTLFALPWCTLAVQGKGSAARRLAQRRRQRRRKRKVLRPSRWDQAATTTRPPRCCFFLDSDLPWPCTLHPSLPPREEAKSVRSARGVSGRTLHQDEMGGGREKTAQHIVAE